MKTATITEKRIRTLLRQIEELRARRFKVLDSFAGNAREIALAIGSQIQELYNEIDAISEGSSKVESAWEPPSDEPTIRFEGAQPAELIANGWTYHAIVAKWLNL